MPPRLRRLEAAIVAVAALAVLALVAVALLHHHRRLGLERLDADGHEAEDVLVDAHLALHLGDRRRRGVEVEEREMRLAVLLDAVGEGLDAPHLGLLDLAAVLLDDALVLVDHRLDLLGRHVLASHEDVFVERHIGPFSRLSSSLDALMSSEASRFDASDRRQALRASQGPSGCRRRRHGTTDPKKPCMDKPAVRSAPGRSEREGGAIVAYSREGKECSMARIVPPAPPQEAVAWPEQPRPSCRP